MRTCENPPLTMPSIVSTSDDSVPLFCDSASERSPNAVLMPPLTSLMAPTMFSRPTSSIIFSTPLVTALDMLSMAVCTPPCAVSACSLNEVMPSPPSVSSFVISCSSWSIEMVAHSYPAFFASFSLPPPSA